MAYQEDNGPPMFTYAMLAAYVGVFAAQVKSADGISYLHAYSWRLAEGQTWRLITATLLHGDLLHVAFNAFWFVRFSRVIENWLGPWIALGLYAFFAAGSMGAQMLVSSPITTPIGASGAVYGLFGFLWVLRRRRDDAAEAVPVSTSQMMIAWLFICIVLDHYGRPIANTAHVVGLGLGWATGHAVIASKKWRPLIWTATLVVGLLIPTFTYGPVWQATFGHIPSQWIKFNPSLVDAEARQYFEHPPPDREVRLRPRIF